MKIVMLCEFFADALEYQENLLVRYYLNKGHDVTVITSTFNSVFDYYADKHDNSIPSSIREVDGARIINLRYRYNILNRIRAYTPIDDILEQEKPDLLYVHCIMPNLPECIRYVKRNKDTRMIMDYHADYSNSGKNWISIKILHGIIRKYFLNRARPYLSRIFPIVPAGVDFLHEVYGVPLEEMELLPLGTDLNFASRVRGERRGRAIRETLGIAPQDFVVFTGGKLNPLKKTEHLIDAIRSLPDRDLHLIIAGAADPNEPDYAALLERHADGDPRIHFGGWQDKAGLYDHLDASQIAVFPASQSVLWQQSLGMGLPLVVSERSNFVPGRQDVGYMNLYDNIQVLDHARPLAPQIAAHVRAMKDDPALLALRSAGALRVANELLDWNKLIEQTLRFNQVPAPT
jgi:1,2-diacylglycerol 3-alpha-glucosyltransferase